MGKGWERNADSFWPAMEDGGGWRKSPGTCMLPCQDRAECPAQEAQALVFPPTHASPPTRDPGPTQEADLSVCPQEKGASQHSSN